MRIEQRSEYELDDEKTGFYLTSGTKLVCPVCGCQMRKFGRRKRNMITASETKKTFTIQRMRCTNMRCRKIHHVLPEGTVPYHQYTAEVMEKSLNGESDGVTCEGTTRSAWRSWFKRTESILTDIAAKLKDILQVHVPLIPLERQPEGWLGRTVRAAVNMTGRLSTQFA